MKNKKSRVLVIYNKYLKSGGGEEVMVKSEIEILIKHGYIVFYKEYNNAGFHEFSFRSLLNPLRFFFSISSFIQVWHLVRNKKIDIVHVHNFFYTASPSVFWAAKFAGAKTIATLHNYKLFCLNANFFRNGQICFSCYENKNFRSGIKYHCFKSSNFASALFAWSLLTHRRIGTWRNKIDTFIVLNPFMRTLLEDIGVNKNKIVFKPNFIPTQPFIENAYKESFYFFAGRLENEKGIHHLIETFNLNGKPLIIAGSGDLSTWVIEHAKPNIKYAGLQAGPQMKELMQKCRALIFPSLWIEGMPMTIIEAQASGTIVIAAETINTKTMISDGHNGFLYEAGNIDSLNNVLNTFEKKTIEELAIISLNARQHYELEYTELRHLEIIEKLYAES